MDGSTPIIPLEDHFKSIVDTAPVLIWIAGTDQLCNFFNVGWLQFTGRTLAQELGNGWLEGVHPQDVGQLLETYKVHFNARTSFKLEFRLKHNNGRYYWLLNSAVPKYDNNGNFVGYIGSCIDIDGLLNDQRTKQDDINIAHVEREQYQDEALAAVNQELRTSVEELTTAQQNLSILNAELEKRVAVRTAELSRSESRFRFLIEGAPTAIGVLKGSEFIIESANEMILNLWGKSAEVIGKKLEDALPELKGQPFLGILTNVYETGETYYGNEAHVTLEKDGVYKQYYVNFIYKSLKGANGLTDAIMVVANDVTEQVTSRLMVEHARQRLNNIVMTAPIAMAVLKGPDYIIEVANRPMLTIWDRALSEVSGRTLLSVFPELVDQPFPALLAQVFTTGQSVAFPESDAIIASPKGDNKIIVDFSYDALFDSNGEVEAILATVQDVTEVVHARRQLELSEEELQSINEEMAATNEELTATNEELNISNEALKDAQSKLNEMLGEITAKEERFRFMLNAIPQQVWTANPDGELDYVNDVVVDNFGINATDIIGKGWAEFIHPDDLSAFLKNWAISLSNGTEYAVEFRLKFADGTYQWHLARALPLIEDGKVVLWLGTNTNISVQKDNEAKKDEFISIASHELKTPLTSIKGYIQLMARAAETERMQGFIRKSSDQVFRLEKLILDLLDVTKINAGKMHYTMEPFNFKEMLRSSIESLQLTCQTHQLVLLPCDDFTYIGDFFRLEQVVHNFVGNAIKYSPGGEKIIIQCNINQDNIIVSIQDFGIGIAKENLKSLFERYYRVDNTAMRFEGLGLGLFISSEILKRHQGSFWIESEVGKGSTFYFGLPIQIEESGSKNKYTDTFYRDEKITIAYHKSQQLMEVDWIGFQDINSVKKGGMLMLEMLSKNQCTKVLNDNTNVMGTWSEAADWAGGEWFPMMQKAGLTHFAWVYSKSGFSQLSAQKTVDIMVGDVIVQFFDDMELAKQWINNVG